MAPKQFKTVGQYITILKEEKKNNNSQALWYRGHANKDWTLIPSLLRKQCVEQDLISKFKQNATILLPALPDHELEWLLIMQHYSIPTRLLDWSENPLVALYFAVNGDNGENDSFDGALWILKPSKLNEIANITMDENRIPSIEEHFVENYKPSHLKYEQQTLLKPISIIPPRNTQRMHAQSGVFTIWHRDPTPIEDISKGNCVKKLLIPKDSKKEIKAELDLLGINKFSLFPELGSISSIL